MLKVICDNRLRLVSGLTAEVSADLIAELTYKNPQHYKLVALGYKHNVEPKTIAMWSRESGVLTLPRGAMQILRNVLSAHGVEYEVEDRRTAGDASVTGSYLDPWGLKPGCEFPPHKLVMWDHQRKIVDAIKTYQQCLLRSPTGSGKTSAVIAAIVELGVPALVIMWDSGLLKQWQERIVSELGIPVHEQGLIRGPVCRLKGITLAMQQTLHTWTDTKWDQILPVFGLVACDEVQRYAASTFTKQVDRFPAKYRIGVSADERRKDGKEFVIYSMFGQVKLEVSKKELVDKQLIHEVEVFVVPTAFNAPWYAESIEVRKDAVADGKRIKTSPQNFTNLITEMQQNKARNQLALSMIKECVDAGLPTLTFTHRVDHAKMLDAMVSGQGIAGGLALGGDDWSDQFDATVAGLRDGSLMVGCGTFGKLGVGHDIPTVAAGIVVTPVHNNRAFFGQVKGRICRTSQGKQNARVIVLWDWKVFGLVPIFNMRKWNPVMRVWCEWDKRWKDVDTFLLEVKRNGRYSTTKDSPEESTIGGLFGTVR
jgi:superfamily II DNA or RNA helicase